jgi:hypothetical protein
VSGGCRTRNEQDAEESEISLGVHVIVLEGGRNEAEPRNMHYIITEIKNARFIRDIRVIRATKVRS